MQGEASHAQTRAFDVRQPQPPPSGSRPASRTADDRVKRVLSGPSQERHRTFGVLSLRGVQLFLAAAPVAALPAPGAPLPVGVFAELVGRISGLSAVAFAKAEVSSATEVAAKKLCTIRFATLRGLEGAGLSELQISPHRRPRATDNKRSGFTRHLLARHSQNILIAYTRTPPPLLHHVANNAGARAANHRPSVS